MKNWSALIIGIAVPAIIFIIAYIRVKLEERKSKEHRFNKTPNGGS